MVKRPAFSEGLLAAREHALGEQEDRRSLAHFYTEGNPVSLMACPQVSPPTMAVVGAIADIHTSKPQPVLQRVVSYLFVFSSGKF